ncbi:MAG: type II toxin-antitoxin system HicB family antitoxin [Nanoarchaeota archaeon]|nr:type II toxin-antitoxin system HicB family antitoxin [Nanoarchaeota archaeon]MBU4299621.1 type II toxin-antitoxin system HicB family antitoxin [Nanoarchaeota archaeon]MBU4452611.1 type II toxin-antitoxin system HicB family antitoxin [Nanoarchaeota archaeon]MCG2723922.1 type II toxin-antitoxin system HicB family antitoxin [archaeon]
MEFIVILMEEETGYSVQVPALPGCHTQGDTIDEALANAKEAIECYLESAEKDEIPKAPSHIQIAAVSVSNNVGA